MYLNSTRGERGVCIAINWARNVEVEEETKDTVLENYIILNPLKQSRPKSGANVRKEWYDGVNFESNRNGMEWNRII